MLKSTDELLEALSGAQTIDDYLEKNSDSINAGDVSIRLNAILDSRRLDKRKVIRSAQMSEVYGYQIFSGTRKAPSRDKILALLVAMELGYDEIQQFFKETGYPPLYAKSKRDSIVIFCINKKMSVEEINKELFRREEIAL